MYIPITSKAPKRNVPEHQTRVAVVGTSHVKYVYESFAAGSLIRPTVYSWSGARIVDLIREIDALPRAVDVIVLDCGTNDLADTEPEKAMHFMKFLLGFIKAARPQTVDIFVTMVHRRSVNRRLSKPNHRQVSDFNRRADEFNRLLTEEAVRVGGFVLMDHGLHRYHHKRVLAADGRVRSPLADTGRFAVATRRGLFVSFGGTLEAENGRRTKELSADMTTWFAGDCPRRQQQRNRHAVPEMCRLESAGPNIVGGVLCALDQNERQKCATTASASPHEASNPADVTDSTIIVVRPRPTSGVDLS